jgi:hypothetical protein
MLRQLTGVQKREESVKNCTNGPKAHRPLKSFVSRNERLREQPPTVNGDE